jgi:hypothetical protein
LLQLHCFRISVPLVSAALAAAITLVAALLRGELAGMYIALVSYDICMNAYSPLAAGSDTDGAAAEAAAVPAVGAAAEPVSKL